MSTKKSATRRLFPREGGPSAMPNSNDTEKQCEAVMNLALEEIEIAKEKNDREAFEYWVDQYAIYHQKWLKFQ